MTQKHHEILIAANNAWADEINEKYMKQFELGMLVQCVGTIVYLSSGIATPGKEEYQDYFEYHPFDRALEPAYLIDGLKRVDNKIFLDWIGNNIEPLCIHLGVTDQFFEELKKVDAHFIDKLGGVYRIHNTL